MSEQTLNNTYDNSEQVALHTKKDFFQAAQTGTADELDDSIKYFKYLKMRAEIENDDTNTIQVDGKPVKISQLVAPKSEFEDLRLKLIVLFNKLGPDDSLILELQRDFGVQSSFELASVYANYILSKTKHELLYNIVNGKVGADNVYDSLTSGNDGKRTAAKDAIRKRTITTDSLNK